MRERRTALINYLRTPGGASKRQVHETLKEMHARTQAELAAFLKIRVYEGWQMGQMLKQMEALRAAGFPMIMGNDPVVCRELLNYLLLNL